MRLFKPHCWLLLGLLLLTAAVWSQDGSPKKSAVLVFSTPAATAAAAAFYARPQGTVEAVKPPEAVPPQTSDPLVIRGEYLARAGDCISCHTRAQGAPFAGGLPLKTPFGTIVSTNITPDMALGIGNYKLEGFIRVMRRGKARDGHYIYPAMPCTNFSRLADDDMRAPYAYFMKGVTPVRQDNAKTDLLWPFSMRWLMAGWNLIYLPDKPFQSDAVQSAEWNRGAYLVQGLGHCSARHTPRSLAGGEKASTEKDGNVFLSVALIDGW